MKITMLNILLLCTMVIKLIMKIIMLPICNEYIIFNKSPIMTENEDQKSILESLYFQSLCCLTSGVSSIIVVLA